MSHSIAEIRREYILQSLSESDVADNAIDQFTNWWQVAIKAGIEDINAMTLATASKESIPSARIVLLKGYDTNGFIFFTNYQSQKGKDLADNPQGALLFFWKELERQIRLDGIVMKISAEESDTYFQSRPAASRIGAWASPQSSVISDRKVIENNFLMYEEKFGIDNIPRPEHWGGYVLKPRLLEFWQGRSNRLHDRIQYELQLDGDWKIERLAP